MRDRMNPEQWRGIDIKTNKPSKGGYTCLFLYQCLSIWPSSHFCSLLSIQDKQRELIQIKSFSLRDDCFWLLKSRRQKSMSVCGGQVHEVDGWLINLYQAIL